MRPSPCKDCPERFTACSDHCPIDARGGYGHKAWKAELDAETQAARLRNSIDWTNAKPRDKWRKSW